jgi:hypothetical protein
MKKIILPGKLARDIEIGFPGNNQLRLTGVMATIGFAASSLCR